MTTTTPALEAAPEVVQTVQTVVQTLQTAADQPRRTGGSSRSKWEVCIVCDGEYPWETVDGVCSISCGHRLSAQPRQVKCA